LARTLKAKRQLGYRAIMSNKYQLGMLKIKDGAEMHFNKKI